jgi:hypothetical protein
MLKLRSTVRHSRNGCKLVSARSLTSRRVKLAKSTMRRLPSTLLPILFVALIGGGLMTAPVVESNAPIPLYAERVAGGRLDRGSWGIWLFGRRDGGRCWATRTVERGFPREDAYCGFSVPPEAWQLAARGSVGTGQDDKSLLFFLTRRSIAWLNVLVGHRPNQRDAWIHMRVRILTAVQARHARLPRNFGYAVKTFPGSLGCVKRVIAHDLAGRRVHSTKPSGC